MGGVLLFAPPFCSQAPPVVPRPARYQPRPIKVSSPDVSHGKLASAVGCGGTGRAPVVDWTFGGHGTLEYLVHVVNLDAKGPGGQPYTQWLVYNLPLATSSIRQPLPSEAIQGVNDHGTAGYIGPCPPPGQAQRIEIVVLALKRRLHANVPVPWVDVMAKADALTFSSGELTATYSR